MEKKTIDILYFSFIFLFLILLSLLYIEMKTAGFQCANDPLIYGIERLEKANSDILSCDCSFKDLKRSRFTLTNKGIELYSEFKTSPFSSELNISQLIIQD